MTARGRGLVLLVVQLVLVLSIAAKYVYERKTCPRVWVRTAQIDPNQPFRGRYLALQLAVDACGLPHDAAASLGGPGVNLVHTTGWKWRVKPEVRAGKLIAVLAGDDVRPELTQELTQRGERCDRATLTEFAEYFIGDQAKSPFPLKSNEELWVEVTVPPSGPPRPIQLAMSNGSTFTPIVVR
jgi:GDYXXLXY protein